MNTCFRTKTATPLVLAVASLFAACTADTPTETFSELPENTDQPSQQVEISGSVISDRVITTDCGDLYDGFLVAPGFAEARDIELRDLPPPMTAMLAIGGGRELLSTDYDQVSSGYVLMEPLDSKQSFLINTEKEVVATIEGDYFPLYTQMLDNGNHLIISFSHTDIFPASGGSAGCVEERTAEGDLLWRINMNTEQYIQHHDVIKLENGNILAMIWDLVSADEAIALGRNPEHVGEDGTFFWDAIIEVNPETLEIVWEWNVKDHLIQDVDPNKPNYGVIADHPERIDINKTRARAHPDWLHNNAFDYNPELDQIMLSSNYLSEIWFIDHSTRPEESMSSEGGRYGKGGDFLYRWGNPSNYDQGSEDDRLTYNQHDIQWILPGLPGAGNILIYNNGDRELRPYTSLIELVPDMNEDGSYNLTESGHFGVGEIVWEYDPDPSEQFLSWFLSGAQRLSNGNTLVAQGAGGHVREINPEGKIVWDYSFNEDPEAPPHMLFRTYKYEPDHPGLVNLLLSN